MRDRKELQETHGAQAAERHIQKALTEHPTIEPEQAEAARKLVTGKGSLRTLQGIAGSGKSYTLDTVRAAFEKAGYRVIGGALSGIAKEELAAQANISSRTIASYIFHLDKSRLRKAYDRNQSRSQADESTLSVRENAGGRAFQTIIQVGRRNDSRKRSNHVS